MLDKHDYKYTYMQQKRMFCGCDDFSRNTKGG